MMDVVENPDGTLAKSVRKQDKNPLINVQMIVFDPILPVKYLLPL